MLLIEDKMRKYLDIEVPTNFGYDIDNDDFTYLDGVENAIRKINNRVMVNNGVSKLAIIDYDSSIVLKIPFNGEWHSKGDCYNCCEWNEEKQCCECGGCDDDFIPFEGAIASDCDDYCLAEVELFEKLKEAGLDMFFAATDFYGYTKNNKLVYCQERVIPLNADRTDRTPSEKSQKELKERKELYSLGNSYWTALAIDAYGINKVIELEKFIDDKYPEIGEDLHSGNIGFRLDGTPVILDYSGWSN